MYLLQLFDWYAASISGILISLANGIRNFVRDIEFMIGHRLERGWSISWKCITAGISMVSGREWQV